MDSNSSSNKLAYLRDAIRDPGTKPLLYSGIEHDEHYEEVVALLHRRFDKRRLTYCRTIADMGPVKTTRTDINNFADTLSHTVSGIKHTGQYSSCITSLSASSLTKALQVKWEMHAQETKDVPPVEDFIAFLRVRADALSVQSTQSSSKPEPRPEPPKRQRAAVHAAIPTLGFKYECILCADKHPLYLCPKFNTMTVNQRGDHIRTHKFCYNCLAPGHKTADCRSIARCKTCSGCHHTMVHRDTSSPSTSPSATVAVNSLASNLMPAVPHSLIMTSQVLLKGPGGCRLVARALLDSGSSMSLVSARAAQCLQLTPT